MPVPKAVSKALEACPNRNEKYFFWSGVGKRTSAVNVWQETFQGGFGKAKVPNGHIHRFRHTFAVSLLQKGGSIDLVSVLLAHSSIRVTERHYAPWVKEAGTTRGGGAQGRGAGGRPRSLAGRFEPALSLSPTSFRISQERAS